jgi:DNA-binding CsgD family transcriptional regulator
MVQLNPYVVYNDLRYRKESAKLPFDLTLRQWQVAHLTLDGLDTKRISKVMVLAEQTVKNHLEEARAKIDSFAHPCRWIARGRAELELDDLTLTLNGMALWAKKKRMKSSLPPAGQSVQE